MIEYLLYFLFFTSLLLFLLTNFSFADWEIKKGNHRLVEVIEIKHNSSFSNEKIKTKSEQLVQGYTISCRKQGLSSWGGKEKRKEK